MSGSGGHDKLAISQGQQGSTATAIYDSAILVSPNSNLKYKSTVPEWIVELVRSLTRDVGGRVVLAGFSRGAKWCHEIIRQLIKMDAIMPIRCLLVAPYCALSFTPHDQREHALAIKRGRTTVRSICTRHDESCKWSIYSDFIIGMGECRDVSDVFPTHEDTLAAFLNASSEVATDIQWLLCNSAHAG